MQLSSIYLHSNRHSNRHLFLKSYFLSFYVLIGSWNLAMYSPPQTILHECCYTLRFRLQTRASVLHRIAMIPFYHGIVIILLFCVLDTINISNNPSFPSLFLNSDDSVRIVMILTTIYDNSSRNVTILTQNITDSTEKCQFHPSSFAQLQST